MSITADIVNTDYIQILMENNMDTIEFKYTFLKIKIENPNCNRELKEHAEDLELKEEELFVFETTPGHHYLYKGERYER